MKKLILVGVIAFVIGAIFSQIAGMAIRSLSSGMAPDGPLLLVNKIDEESKQNCENSKSCRNRIEDIKSNINYYENFIIDRERDIETRNEEIDKAKKKCANNVSASEYDACLIGQNVEGYNKAIKNHEGLIKDEQFKISNAEGELNSLLNGECKDYQNPCE